MFRVHSCSSSNGVSFLLSFSPQTRFSQIFNHFAFLILSLSSLYIFFITYKTMAKLTLRTDYNNINSLLPHHKTHQSLTFKTSFRNPTTYLNLSLLPLKHRFKFKFSCSIKEKEREDVVDTSERVIKQLSNTKISNGSSEILGTFDFNWKNLPQRYKMIGTTSLAFVICNMDKVLLFFFFYCFLNLGY